MPCGVPAGFPSSCSAGCGRRGRGERRGTRTAGGQAHEQPGDHQGGSAELGGGRGSEAQQDRGDDGADRYQAGEQPRAVGAEPGERVVPEEEGAGACVQADTRTGPSLGSKGIARREKHASHARAPTEYSNPARLPLPSPLVTVAPTTTTAAATSTRQDGRDRTSNGPTSARTTGTVPTVVPTRVGLAWRVAWMTHTLNSTSPVAARDSSSSAWRGVSRTRPSPLARATANRIVAARA